MTSLRAETIRVHTIRLFAAVSAAVLLLMAATGPAGAASPTLTPSENPVAFTCGGPTTKQVSLAWNLNGLSKANLVITEEDNSTPFTQQILTQTGSLSRTVTYSKNQVAVLRDVSTNAILTSVTITTTRPLCGINPPPPGLLCAISLCINSITANPHGTYVELPWTTSKPASMVVEVKQNGATIATGFSLGYVTSGTTTVFTLEPNTSYTYVATAHDQNGGDATKSGSFTTHKRRVTVTFERVYMIDDSDGGLSGDCDCKFYFQAGNEPVKTYVAPGQGVPSSTNVYPNKSFTINNAPDSVLTRVMTVDEDCTQLFGVCFDIIFPSGPTWNTGSNSQGEWATASKTVSTVPTSLGNEAYTETFQMTSPSNGLPRFTAHGSYTVSYAP